MTSHEQHELDLRFKNEAEYFTIAPSDGTWDGISSALASSAKTRSISRWLLAAASITLLCSVGVWWMTSAPTADYHVESVEVSVDHTYNDALLHWIRSDHRSE